MRLQPILGCKAILAKVQEDDNRNILTGRKKEGGAGRCRPKPPKEEETCARNHLQVACKRLEAVLLQKFPCLEQIL